MVFTEVWHLSDDAGQVWCHSDLERLQGWVHKRNALLKTIAAVKPYPFQAFPEGSPIPSDFIAGDDAELLERLADAPC